MLKTSKEIKFRFGNELMKNNIKYINDFICKNIMAKGMILLKNNKHI
jgi:hypothetical protein